MAASHPRALPAPSIPALQARVRPRAVQGISALLLPLQPGARPDWAGFLGALERTLAAGLQPAVNMDTGYGHLLDPHAREEVLRRTAEAVQGRPFVAGAYADGAAGALVDRYARAAGRIREAGGTPILFQCAELTALPDRELVGVYRGVAERAGPILGFELGEAFAPFGRVYSLETFAALLEIPGLVGIKHSSLDRRLEWQRLEVRDRLRPEFRVYTGNDLAIDMIIYGSDYLLGLAAFCPEAFALRDRLWASGDPCMYQVNDLLQYLGAFAFRSPTPAYKHSAAQFLHLRGQIAYPLTHPRSPTRPDSDLAILREISDRVDVLLSEDHPNHRHRGGCS